MLQIKENDFEIIEENEKYSLVKFHRNPKLGFNFDFEIYIPASIRENANLLVTFDYSPEKLDLLIDRLGAPIMRPNIQNFIDENGNEINFKQFDSLALIDKNGEKVAYRDPNIEEEQSNNGIIEQYKAAIGVAYKYLKQEGVISEEKPEKIDVEGYSYQGVIAQRMGMLFPDEIRSVICGGAITSIPIPRTSYMGTRLPYPTGIDNIEEILGISPEEYVEKYKNVIQILYVTEQELKYDGSFTENGVRIKRDENGRKIDKTQISVSQHDISPEVVDTVVLQRELFGDDINDRTIGAIELAEEAGCAVKKLKIYTGTDHHISDMNICMQAVDDMCSAITSMDNVEAVLDPHAADVQGYELDCDINGRPVVKIDTSYESKRREIQTRLSKVAQSEEAYEALIDEILIELASDPEECKKFLFITDMGNGKEKTFLYEFAPSRIRKAIELVRGSKESRAQILGMQTLKEQKDTDGKTEVNSDMSAQIVVNENAQTK